MYKYIYTHIYTYIYRHIYIYTYLYACMCIYIYIFTEKYIPCKWVSHDCNPLRNGIHWSIERCHHFWSQGTSMIDDKSPTVRCWNLYYGEHKKGQSIVKYGEGNKIQQLGMGYWSLAMAWGDHGISTVPVWHYERLHRRHQNMDPQIDGFFGHLDWWCPHIILGKIERLP